MLVYCGQTVGWIMALGMVVGLDPGHIVLDGDPAPPHQTKIGDLLKGFQSYDVHILHNAISFIN